MKNQQFRKGKGLSRFSIRLRSTVISAVLTTILVLLLRTPAAAAPAQHYTDLAFPPLPAIQLPDYTRFQLNNGMVVYLIPDRELPLVSGTALFQAGDRWEPLEQVGLGSLTGTVMRTGGTQQHSPDALNQLLEQRAASVETGVSTAAGRASFDALSEDLDAVFSLFAEVVRQPAFNQQQFDLALNQRRGNIARRNDSPDSIASREFSKLIYGDNSPYARTIEYATLDNISREDVVEFYQTSFQPDRTILGIVGDFDPQDMRSLIQAKFGDWQSTVSAEQLDRALPEVAQANPKGVFLVDQPQLTQSYVQMGHLGGQLNDPDFAALDVLNGVMNGFGGRLFNEVRSRQGLAYVVFAAWSARYDYPGIFIAGGQTRSDATVPFIQSIFSELDKLRTAPVTAKELAYAKDSTINSFIFKFQSPRQILSRLMNYEYYGYPEDFLFQYRKAVETTTAADVQRVAKQYLQPDRIITLVVGNKAAIQPPLSQLGQGNPTPIDITIPDPTSSKPTSG